MNLTIICMIIIGLTMKRDMGGKRGQGVGYEVKGGVLYIKD